MKAVIYSRVSTGKHEQALAYENQLEFLIDTVNQNDWTLIDSYQDNGVSGTTAKRSEFQRLINDIELRKFDILVVKETARLGRNTEESLAFVNLCEANGIKIYIALDRKFYNYDERFLNTIKHAVDAQYSEDLGKKIKQSHKTRVSKGRTNIPKKTYGYNVETVIDSNDNRRTNQVITINEKQAEMIRLIYNSYVSGIGFQKISNIIYDKGFRNTKGDRISLTVIKRILDNEIYAGTLVSNRYEYNPRTKKRKENPKSEWVKVPNVFPRIISKEIFDKAQLMRSKKRQSYTKPDGSIHVTGYKKLTPLSGKIKCGQCGESYWHVRNEPNARNQYICRTKRKLTKKACDNKTLQESYVYEQINEVLLSVIRNKDAVIDSITDALKIALNTTDYSSKIAKLQGEIQKLTKRKSVARNMRMDEEITPTEFKEISAELKAEIAKLEIQIGELLEKQNNSVNISERLFGIKQILNTMLTDKVTEEMIEAMIHEIIVKEDGRLEITLFGLGDQTLMLADNVAARGVFDGGGRTILEKFGR